MLPAPNGPTTVMPSTTKDSANCRRRCDSACLALLQAGDENWPLAGISCSSTRSVGARMNTSHIMSGSC
jgi:hypothetical protein